MTVDQAITIIDIDSRDTGLRCRERVNAVAAAWKFLAGQLRGAA